jgi:hypothetical protein
MIGTSMWLWWASYVAAVWTVPTVPKAVAAAVKPLLRVVK